MRHKSVKARRQSERPISNIPGSFFWILSVLIAAVVSLPFDNLGMAPRPVPAPVAPQVETRIATVGQDANHRSLPFTIYVLSDQLSWKLESTDELQGQRQILNPELIAAINRAADVFCVGTASFEGDARAEEARAARRAATLAQWVGAVIGSPAHTHVFTLTAGQYKGPNDVDSSYQRKAIILIAGPHDDKVNMAQGLRSGLEYQQQTPLVYRLLHDYSNSRGWLKSVRPAVPLQKRPAASARSKT